MLLAGDQELGRVEPGHHVVEQDQVGRLGGRVERAATVGERLDGEALALEHPGHHGADVLVVVDHRYPLASVVR